MIMKGIKRYMLTIKQERYVQELIKGKSQREAYRIAYPGSVKWKPESVDAKASALFKNDKVRIRYEELTREIEKDVIADVEEVKRLLIETQLAIIKAEPTDLFDIAASDDGMSLVSVAKAEIKVDKRAIKGYKYDSQGRLIIEFYDKQKAIDSLKDIYGLNQAEEKTEEINITFNSDIDKYGV